MRSRAVTKAVKALEGKFPGVIVQAEKHPGRDRYNLLIISDKFARKSPFRRQDMVWDVIVKSLEPDEAFKILFTFPLLPSEVTEQPSPVRTRKKVVSTRQTLAKN